jgi:predicted P-loop ATPase
MENIKKSKLWSNGISPIDLKVKNSTTSDRNAKSKFEIIREFLQSNYSFRFNEVLKETEYRKKQSKEAYTPIGERELADIQTTLFEAGHTGFKTVLDVLLKSTNLSESFNPFTTYFESLPKWKPTDPDHIGNLCSFVKTEEQHDWFKRMFEKHLIRTVACGLRTLSFNKHCFVFLGKQHDGKTSFFRFLAPEELKPYYKENPPLDHKDSVIALSQNLLINLDELHDLNKSDANRVKSLFSQSDTKIRSHYGVRDTMQQRYASFFGTTNEREFLNDVTGNVRWLVFTINDIFHDSGNENGYNKNVDINLVWSQAYYYVLQGENGTLTNDEVRAIEKQNRSYQRTTPEMDLIEELFEPTDKDNPKVYPVNTTDILSCLNEYTGNTIRLNSHQVTKALSYLGYKKQSVRLPYRKNPSYMFFVKTYNLKIHSILQKKSTTPTTND